MSAMKPERWQQIKILLQSALECEPDQRSAFLAAMCASDESLRKEVETFIISYDQAGAFIEDPAIEVMADLLANNYAESLIGQALGHYTIRAQLGAGGMGEVFLAEDTRLGRKVALKLLPAFFSTEDERVRRFQQEARAASALNHPNILTIYEVGRIDARHFIATEFVEGDTLRQRMMKTPMPIGELLGVATQIASALTTAHQSGIVHRDLKPENIMLRQDGIIKVLDFGLAKLIEQQSGESEATTMFTTQPGVIMGTPHYMSPEQARGLKVDARTDIWSLGVLIYEMIGGRVPFAGETSSDVIVSILEREPPPLARFTPETPEVLQWIITKALRKQTDQRYQTAKELLADLQSLKHRLELQDEVEQWKSGEQAIAVTSKDSALVPVKVRDDERPLDSVAILPLVNTSADPSMEYLSDGVAENIIDNISQLPALRVMAWGTVARYKGRDVTPSEIGRALGVRAVLSGSLRQIGEHLIVRAELVDANDGARLWSARYDRNAADIFTVQEEIAREISEKLRLKLSGEEKQRLVRRRTESTTAYHSYLKGRYFWYKRTESDLRRGIEYFNQAIEEDPGYAAAYDGLSDSYALLALRGIIPHREAFHKSKAAARKALEIDDSLGEAHASLAHIRLHEWDWFGLEEEFKRALELNPAHAMTYHWYSEYLTAMGRNDESIEIIKKAKEIDPLSPISWIGLSSRYHFARRYDDEIREILLGLDVNRDHFLLHFGLGQAYSAAGMHERAVEEVEKAVNLSSRSTETLTGFARVLAQADLKEDARKVLAEVIEQSAERYVSPYSLAKVYAALGEKEQAFSWLEKAYEDRNPDFIELKVEPALDNLRSDARFADLLRRTGLEAAEGFPSASSRKTVLKSSRKRVSRRTIKSLAILPFMNTSADPNMDYLSDGITESIINALSQLPKLRVVARNTVFRYKGREVESREVGHALDVQAVLTGRVHQVADSLIISAELVDVESDSQLWGESYNRKLAGIFEIQAEIAQKIAGTLRLRLSGKDKGRLTRRYTENAAAYQLYLEGRYHWNKRTVERLQKGLECFQQAIAIDPNYALAYAGISDCYAFRGDVGLAAVPSKDAFAMAKQAALRALEIDPTLAEAYASLAHVNMHCFEWAAAEAAFKSAIKINANNAQAHQWYAFYLLFNAQPDKAIAEASRALELDPLSLTAHGDLGQMFHYTRQYDRAIDIYQKALDLEPNRHRVYLWLGWVFEQQTRYDDAIGAFQRAFTEDSTEPLASLGCSYALSGRTDDARGVLKQLKELSASSYVSPYQMSVLLLSMGEESKAFEWLEKAYEQRAEWMIYLSVDPRFDRLRGYPRFADLLRQIGFRL